MTRMLRAAIGIAQHIAPVFPTADGRPRCAHGYHDASRDPDRIRTLWAHCPDANVSIPMGAASGLLGLDVDQKGGRDGFASLDALEAEHGPLPDTLRYSTPNDGRGYLFAHPGGKVPTRFDFRPGLELHSDGAAMTLPPSQKLGRPYVWIRSPREVGFADAPRWLLRLIDRPAVPPNPPRPIRVGNLDRLARYGAAAIDRECNRLAMMAADSGRNIQLFKSAANLGQLVGASILPADMVQEALERAASDCGLAREDGRAAVVATIKSGLARGVDNPREVRP